MFLKNCGVGRGGNDIIGGDVREKASENGEKGKPPKATPTVEKTVGGAGLDQTKGRPGFKGTLVLGTMVNPTRL